MWRPCFFLLLDSVFGSLLLALALALAAGCAVALEEEAAG